MKKIILYLMVFGTALLSAVDEKTVRNKLDDLSARVRTAYRAAGVGPDLKPLSFEAHKQRAKLDWNAKSMKDKIAALNAAQDFLQGDKKSVESYKYTMGLQLNALDQDVAAVYKNLNSNDKDVASIDQNVNKISGQMASVELTLSDYFSTLASIAYHEQIMEKGTSISFRAQRSLHEGMQKIKNKLFGSERTAVER